VNRSHQRPERRSDLLVNLCASRSKTPTRYTRAEHEAALDRLLADLDALEPDTIADDEPRCSINVKKNTSDSDSGFQLALAGA